MMPEHRHAHLVEQVDRAPGVDQRQVLRRRDDHRAGRPRVLDQRQLHVAGARRQVDDSSSASPQSASTSFASAPVAIGPRQRQRVARRDQLAERQEFDPMRFDRDQIVVLGRRACRRCRAASAATGRRRRRRSGRPSCPCWQARSARFAETVDLPTPPFPLPIAIRVRVGSAAVIAIRTSSTPGFAEHRGSKLLLELAAPGCGKAGRIDDQGRDNFR